MHTSTDANESILYAYNFRSRAERELWTLQELRLPYQVIRLDPFNGDVNTAEFRKLNPSAKIPVLIHDGHVLTESLAIMEYLNDISTEIKLIPTGALENYTFRNIIHYGLTELEPYLWIADQATRLRKLYNWQKGTHIEAINRVRSSIDRVWDWIQTDRFIAGDAFSLADIYYYQTLTWATFYKIELPDKVIDYLERLEARDSFPPELRALTSYT